MSNFLFIIYILCMLLALALLTIKADSSKPHPSLYLIPEDPSYNSNNYPYPKMRF